MPLVLGTDYDDYVTPHLNLYLLTEKMEELPYVSPRPRGRLGVGPY